MKTIESFRREELVDSLCHHARQFLIDSFPEQQKLWIACNYEPKVEYEFKTTFGQLVIRYSMIFRSCGSVYKVTKQNVMLDTILQTVRYKDLQAIIDDWTSAFRSQILETSRHFKAIKSVDHQSGSPLLLFPAPGL